MVLGKYETFASLGSGGMADVFLAIARGPKGFNKLIVVKTLKPEFVREPSFVEMFLDEARLAARLNHPNVVQTQEVGESGGTYFIAMEFLEGQPFNRIIDRLNSGGITLDAAIPVRLVSDALAGLHYAHELRDYDGKPLNVIHRDISPHNLFVTYEGQVKVVDFGIAKAASSSSKTEVGVLKGKLSYMAPEQAMGEAMDRRADIYAMGVVLWEALTLKRFASEESVSARIARMFSNDVPRMSAEVPGIDPRLDELVAKALDRDPAKRFQTAAEMRTALEGWISQTGATVRQEEIGQNLGEMFKDARAQVDREVHAQMASVGPSSRVEDLAPPTPVDSRGTSATPAPVQTVTQVVPVMPRAARSGRTGTVALVGGVVVAVVAAAGFGRFSRPASPEAPVAVAPSVPSSTPTVAAASSVIDEGRTDSFGVLPTVVSSDLNPLSDEKISLGRMLYFDERLSKNHDVSCNTCHALDKFGVDGKTVSTGHAQKQGTRNAPTVYNSAGLFALMWDGKFANVEDQVKGPMLNPVEMSSSPKRVEETLQSIPEYVRAFAKAFPGDRSPVTYDNTARAIGAFERKLLTPARWDKFLAGEKGALTDAEKAGFNTFVDVGCPTCHFGTYVGGTMFQKLGLVKPWPSTRDRGRFELTQKNEDYMVFRVPSLRNVAVTGPYLHDGSITSLAEVVHMMARHQIGKEITDAQAASIVTWLGTLTGEPPHDYIQKPDLPPIAKNTPPPEL